MILFKIITDNITVKSKTTNSFVLDQVQSKYIRLLTKLSWFAKGTERTLLIPQKCLRTRKML